MSQENYRLSGPLASIGKVFLAIAGLGGIGCVVSYLQNPQVFFSSYLTAFVFFMCIALGSLFFVMVHHLAKSGWNVTVRRIAENIAANLPWMTLLFIPLLFGISYLFYWTHADVQLEDKLIQSKHAYLNLPFFYIRAAFYFLVWTFFGRWFLMTSVKQDNTGDALLTDKMAKYSTFGMILFAFTQTFFIFDWVMSIDAHWYSTMFGVYYFAGSVVCAYATIIIVSYLLRVTGNLKESITVEHYHDLGKLLFGHNVFWTYIGFSQFMLIWYTNIPEETLFFHHRAVGSWKIISLMLPWCHFAIPFVFLMSRNVKRKLPLLVTGATWLFIMCYIDIYWLVQPNFHHEGASFGVSDISSIFFVGGIFIFLFLNRLKKYPLIPINDPRLPQCLNYDNG